MTCPFPLLVAIIFPNLHFGYFQTSPPKKENRTFILLNMFSPCFLTMLSLLLHSTAAQSFKTKAPTPTNLGNTGPLGNGPAGIHKRQVPSGVALPSISTSAPLMSASKAWYPIPPANTVTAPLLPYYTGVCSFNLSETQTCQDKNMNLYAILTLLDGKRNQIGQTVTNDSNPFGDSINQGNSTTFTSGLPYQILVTGEHDKDDVHFLYGKFDWTSKTKKGDAHCKSGHWKEVHGVPGCAKQQQRNMTCQFPC